MIIFNIPGKPFGKQRPQFKRGDNNGTHTYTPSETKEYEQRVITCYKLSRSKEKFFNKEPLVMTIVAYYDIPKSTSKKARERMLNGEVYPTKKPDYDNISKVISDALNKVAYGDDAQIVRGFVFKEYTDGDPYVKVKIRQLTPEDKMQK